jgi:hypothetical protein
MWMPGDYGALESVYTLDGELESESERERKRERALTYLLCVCVRACVRLGASDIGTLFSCFY